MDISNSFSFIYYGVIIITILNLKSLFDAFKGKKCVLEAISIYLLEVIITVLCILTFSKVLEHSK